MWRDKQEIILLSTNILPQPEIHAQHQQDGSQEGMHGAKWDMKKKSEVINLHNLGMKEVNVNDQVIDSY